MTSCILINAIPKATNEKSKKTNENRKNRKQKLKC